MADKEQVVRDARGRWVPGTLPAGAAPPITSENARDMIRRRQEKYRSAAVRRVLGEVQAVAADVVTPADAWGFIVARQAVALIDSDKPRLLDTKILGQLLGAVPTELERGNDQGGPALVLNTEGAAMVGKLLDLVKDMAKAGQAGASASVQGGDGGGGVVLDGQIVE